MHLSYKKFLLLNKYIGKIKLYMVIIKKKYYISERRLWFFNSLEKYIEN